MAIEHLGYPVPNAPLIERSVLRAPIERQRKWVGITVACLGAGLVYFVRHDPPALVLSILASVGLVCAVDYQAQRALRYGYSLRVFEDRIEFQNAGPARTLPLFQIDRLLDKDGPIVAVLMNGEEVALPSRPELNDVYRYLLNTIPGNFKVPN